METMFLVGFIVAGVIAQAWTGPATSPPGGTGTIVPSTVVTFFNSTTCPSGWTEVTAARGRYLVGLPSATSTLAGTAGTALTDLENRNLGTHTHGASGSLSAHTHPVFIDNGGTFLATTGTNGIGTAQGTLSVTVNALTLPAGTPAPYIQFLVCQKS